MSRDYKPASKTRPSRKANPIWMGVLAGVFVSLIIALIVMFALKQQGQPSASTQEQLAQPSKPVEATLSAPKKSEKPRFDFYTILPGLEEPISDQDIKAAAAHPETGNYFLQAGSFQAIAEADNLKAKLALMGIEANIETATIPEKGIWHRVRVGPFDNIQELNSAREMLTQNGISASPVKVHRR